MKPSVLLLIVGVLLLSGCVTQYPPKYEIYFYTADPPVMLNDWAVETDRSLQAEVMDTHTEAHATTMTQSTMQTATGDVYRVYETGTTQLSSYTASIDAPLQFQIESRLQESDSALFIRNMEFRSYILFFMGVASLESRLSVEVDVYSGGHE